MDVGIGAFIAKIARWLYIIDMNKHNGFHNIKLIFAELIFSGTMLALFASPVIYAYLIIAVVVAAILAIITNMIIATYRQVPTLLGYTDLANDKAKMATRHAKTAIKDSQTTKKSLRYANN